MTWQSGPLNDAEVWCIGQALIDAIESLPPDTLLEITRHEDTVRAKLRLGFNSTELSSGDLLKVLTFVAELKGRLRR